jgi:hypothetical protein
MKLDLLTNSTVVDDDAIRFVSDRSKDKENLTSSTGNSNEDDTEESNKPDYDEADEDRLEVEQEKDSGELIFTADSALRPN